MRSTFMSLELGKRAVLANQYALDVTGHNVANANTEGYTRQEAVLKTTSPFSAPQMYHVSLGQFGTGVEVTEIRRLRDNFYDLQFRNENKNLGLWSTKKDALDKVEGILNEPTNNSLGTVLNSFWSSLEDLSQHPETESVRGTVYESANDLCDTFHHLYQQAKELQADLNSTVKIKVDEVNDLASQIAVLNKQIQEVSITGQKPNDLLDRRDLLLDKMSKIVDIDVISEKANSITVVVGGRSLVYGQFYAKLEASQDANGMNRVVWQDSPNLEVSVGNGELQGLLEARGINNLFWDTHETNITRVADYFEDSILNKSIKTQTADDDAASASQVNRLYEYSQYSGNLVPETGMTSTTSRNDLNGQILLEVVSKDDANNLVVRYTTDTIDRTGSHYVNTGTINVTNWGAGGDMVLSGLDLDGDGGAESLDLSLTALTNGSAAFSKGDKLVLGLTAERTAGTNSNDGLLLTNMDTTSSSRTNELQYWFDDGVLENRRLNLGSFALDEVTGEVMRNDSFEVTFSEEQLKDAEAFLVNRTGKTDREVFSQEIVDPYTGIVPTIMDRLNTLAKNIVEEMNKQHRKGYNLNTYPNDTNVDFFKAYGDVSSDFEWADNIELSDEIKKSVDYIAAAKSATHDSYGNRINSGDGGNALSMARIKQATVTGLGGYTMDDYWSTTVSQNGVITQQAERMISNEETLVNQIETKRQSVSGVSLDEEMTNMIKFEQAYNAAARYMTTIDQALETIINRMGTVGL
ncbi:MAG: flagellar hook-associated protein FlgK [Chitinophagales bacterium]